MTEEQIQQLASILMAQGMEDAEIALALEAFSTGQPVSPQVAAALEPHRFNLATRVTEGVNFGGGEPGLGPSGMDAKAPLSFAQSQGLTADPTMPPRAAIDREVAGATNEQIAQMMAQATGGGGEILDPWADAPDMSGGRQGLRAATGGQDIASQRAGAKSAGAAALGAGNQAGQLAQLAEQGAANEWMEYGGLAAGLAGTALGVAAPFLERDKKYEASLKRRAAGDTVARQEMDYAAGQMRRNIMGSAMGRRDISPALAMRNAQMAQSQASSQMMARAAMASAQERQMAENELATIRKQRTGQAIDAGLAGLSQVGGFMASQAAAQKQDARSAQKLKAYQDRTAAMRR